MRCIKLTIIVPVYNEIATLQSAYDALVQLDLACEKELVFVDDCSVDGSRELLKEQSIRESANVQFAFHDTNRGKGACFKTAIALATGDYVICHDADNEYDPSDIVALLKKLDTSVAPVVFGSRNLEIKNTYSYWHYFIGAQTITSLFNLFYGQRLTDVWTCYKLVPRTGSLLNGLHEDGFSFELELAIQIARLQLNVCEEPIHYYSRAFRQGKKIRACDGVHALSLLLRCRIRDFLTKRLSDHK